MFFMICMSWVSVLIEMIWIFYVCFDFWICVLRLFVFCLLMISRIDEFVVVVVLLRMSFCLYLVIMFRLIWYVLVVLILMMMECLFGNF